jgi:predicted RND superfamily exporter protein
MVRELAITASLGVGYKILTNLVMLPLVGSYFRVDKAYADKAMLQREQRARWLRVLAQVALPRNAAIVLALTAAVFVVAAWQSRDRVIGTLQTGAPELRPESRFNRDAASIAANYDTGLDWLTVAFEASAAAAGGAGAACENVAIGDFQDEFVAEMAHVPGVLSVSSYSEQLRIYNEGYNEGNPKMAVIPADPGNYSALSVEIGRMRGFMRKDCSMTAVHLFLDDHKSTTINRVIDAVKRFRADNRLEGVTIRLASGNAGVLAAINEVVERSELPMLGYVYAAIVLLVFAVVSIVMAITTS